jgi:hypothetical protein
MGVDPAVLAAMQQMGLQVPQVAAPVVPMAPVPGAPAAPAPPAGPSGPLAPPMAPPQMPGLPGPPGQPGQPGEQPQVPPPFQPPPGVPGQPPMPQLPGQPPPPSPEELAAQEGLKDGAEAAREEGTDDTLGQGARPRRGSSMDNPLDRAAAELSSELRGMASQLASDLFPNGPAGTVRPSNEALGSYMRRHWDDPAFRQVMLDRMAPKGPDGKRVPWGVKAFLKLYKESIAPRGVSNDLTQPVVGPTGFTSFPSNPPPQLEAPPEPPAQVTQITEVPPEEGD